MVNSSAGSKILIKKQFQYALSSVALFGASIFGIYIAYDSAQQFFTDFMGHSVIILVPYGYISLIGAGIVIMWFGFAIFYEKLLNKPVELGIIRLTKIIFISGFLLMILLPILFKTISENRLAENKYTKCNNYESRGTNKWVINKKLC